MRNIFILFLFIPGFSFSQDSSFVKIPADTSAFCIVQLDDGMLLKGRVINQSSEKIFFHDSNLGPITIQLKNIICLEQAGSGNYFLFYMKDGAVLSGEISSQDKDSAEIETKSLGKKKILFAGIKEIRKIDEKDIHKKGKYWYSNMNAYRYFLSPSAIPLHEGEGYYQTEDFIVNNFNYGITNNISVNAGAVIPFGIFIMPKYGYKLKERLHIGGGAAYGQTLLKYKRTNYKIGAVYGIASFGSNNNNISFGAGYGFSNINKETDSFHKPVFMIDGTLRISRRIALVSENLILPIRHTYYNAKGQVNEYNYKHAYIYGCRFIKEKITVDLGWIHYPQDTFYFFPYLDFAIKF